MAEATGSPPVEADAMIPAVRPSRRSAQEPHSFRPVTDVRGVPEIDRRHSSHVVITRSSTLSRATAMGR